MSAFGEYTSNSYGRSSSPVSRAYTGPNYVGFNYDVSDKFEYDVRSRFNYDVNNGYSNTSTAPNYVGFYPFGGAPTHNSNAPKFRGTSSVGEEYPGSRLFHKEEDTVICNCNPYNGASYDIFDEGYTAGYLDAKRRYGM